MSNPRKIYLNRRAFIDALQGVSEFLPTIRSFDESDDVYYCADFVKELLNDAINKQKLAKRALIDDRKYRKFNDAEIINGDGIAEGNVKLILHSAYLAYLYYQWKTELFIEINDNEILKKIISKMPCGDPVSNLLRLSELFLPNYDGEKSIKNNIKIVEDYLYK